LIYSPPTNFDCIHENVVSDTLLNENSPVREQTIEGVGSSRQPIETLIFQQQGS
jgi:hypothetical protein